MTLRLIQTALGTLLLVLCATLVCRAQQQGAPTGSSLAPAAATADAANATSRQVLDVFASNNKSGAPETSLTRDDFELLDEGKPVAATAFHSPRDVGRRPVVLWVVAQCVMQGTTSDGSGFLRKYTTDIASGLRALGPGEAYGLAHWCDDGASSLDLLPNRRIAQLGPALAGVLAPTVTPPNNGLPGEDALIRVVRDAVLATAQYNSEAEPVLLFLYGDHSGRICPGGEYTST